MTSDRRHLHLILFQKETCPAGKSSSLAAKAHAYPCSSQGGTRSIQHRFDAPISTDPISSRPAEPQILSSKPREHVQPRASIITSFFHHQNGLLLCKVDNQMPGMLATRQAHLHVNCCDRCRCLLLRSVGHKTAPFAPICSI
jgi:hypothetical protein